MKIREFALSVAAAILLCSCSEAEKPRSGSVPESTTVVSSVEIEAAEEVGTEYKTVIDGNYPGGHVTESLRSTYASGCYVISDGAYYVDSFSGANRVSFVDFNSMKTMPVCSRPNCLHNDENTCTAFGLSGGVSVSLCYYDGSIYFVNNVRESLAQGGVSLRAEIYKANADGSERRKVASLEGFSLDTLFVSKDMGYTVASEEIFDENGLPTGEHKYYAVEFDFKTGELKFLGQFSSCYMDFNHGVLGEYGGAIYILSSGTEEPPDEGVRLYSDEYFELLNPKMTTKIYKIDRTTCELSLSELPAPGEREGMLMPSPDIVSVGDGYYVCQQGNTAIIAKPDGSAVKLEGHRLTERAIDRPVNGMMFNSETKLATELASGDIYKLRNGSISQNDVVLAYFDGDYIVFEYFKREFRRLSPEELFETQEVEEES